MLQDLSFFFFGEALVSFLRWVSYTKLGCWCFIRELDTCKNISYEQVGLLVLPPEYSKKNQANQLWNQWSQNSGPFFTNKNKNPCGFIGPISPLKNHWFHWFGWCVGKSFRETFATIGANGSWFDFCRDIYLTNWLTDQLGRCKISYHFKGAREKRIPVLWGPKWMRFCEFYFSWNLRLVGFNAFFWDTLKVSHYFVFPQEACFGFLLHLWIITQKPLSLGPTRKPIIFFGPRGFVRLHGKWVRSRPSEEISEISGWIWPFWSSWSGITTKVAKTDSRFHGWMVCFFCEGIFPRKKSQLRVDDLMK